ncbi:Protein of unknown function [Pyronema omphalodes CBS 100304]|uniref:Uncharacterized protein n=1 Tax=Pyronema omphalodes (strain CBS 100304) TaxID=1076935 RepID=U4LA12_PYROM|nr:Protein of unknown function [Pyronema omphalodes CBS 100304]
MAETKQTAGWKAHRDLLQPLCALIYWGCGVAKAAMGHGSRIIKSRVWHVIFGCLIMISY